MQNDIDILAEEKRTRADEYRRLAAASTDPQNKKHFEKLAKACAAEAKDAENDLA